MIPATPPITYAHASLLQDSTFPISLTPIAEHLIQLAREHAQSPSQKIPVIGIGGCPGIGKTTITHLLAQQLKAEGISYTIVHFDDWTNPAESRQKGYFDLEGVHNFFTAFLEGKECIEKPVSSEFTDDYWREVLDLRGIDIILFEGLFALCGKEPMNYLRYCDRGIYLEACEQDIWRWKRERPCTVQRTDEEFAQHMKAVFDCHHEFIEPFKSQATWIVNKDTNHGYAIGSPYAYSLPPSQL